MRMAWLLPLVLTGTLGAQESFARFGPRPEGDKSWEAFSGGLARRGVPVFLLIGTEEKAADWVKLLQDEALTELGLEPMRLSNNDPLSAELRRRFGWDGQPRWAALSSQGALLASEQGLPTNGTALTGKLLASGYEGRLQVLESFLRKHPGHGEALEALVKARFEQALRRFSDWQIRTKDSKGTFPDTEDARIFRSFSYALDRLMALPEWPSSFPPQVMLPSDSPKPKSALLAASAWRYLPAVEAQLRRTPNSGRLWALWMFLGEAEGGRPLLPLLESINARPDREGFPLNVPLKRLGEELRSAKAWQRILDTFTPLAASILSLPTFMLISGKGIATTWDELLAPLVEAQFRLGLLDQADDTIRRTLEASKWPGLPGKAGALARACGQPQLARSWEALPVPEVKK